MPCSDSDAKWLPIDLPGHGQASDPRGGFDDVIRALLATIPECVETIVGYSLGGRVALGMLREAPERFRQATIISAHPGLTEPELRAERLDQDLSWIRLLRRQGIEAFVQSWECQPLFETQRSLPPDVLQRQRERRLSQRPEGLAGALESLGLGVMPSAWDVLRDYPGRLRWIVGGEDRKFLAIAQRVRSLRPTTEVAVMAGIGHNPMLEAPRALRRLLD